jgi:hypothetical protein
VDAEFNRGDAINRPQITRIDANFRMKKETLPDVNEGRASACPYAILDFIRLMSDVASLGTWAQRD